MEKEREGDGEQEREGDRGRERDRESGEIDRYIGREREGEREVDR